MYLRMMFSMAVGMPGTFHGTEELVRRRVTVERKTIHYLLSNISTLQIDAVR
jgi:hypothetical protein